MGHSHEHNDHSHDNDDDDDDHHHLDHTDIPDDTEDDKKRREVLQRLKIATVLCLIFMIVEIVGGLWANSLAILSDAAHLTADLVSFAVAIIANYLASLPSTAYHTYGLKRTESLAALFSMLSLAAICIMLGVEAFRRLVVILNTDSENVAQVLEVDGRLMSLIATIGVFVNLALAYVLGENHVHMPGAGGHNHDHDHDHSHSHDHGQAASESDALISDEKCQNSYVAHSDEVEPPDSATQQRRNVNLQAAYLHVLGDLAQSVAVLVAGLIIWFKPEWAIVDPIATLGFCVLVFYSTLGVLRSSVAVLMEEVPPTINWAKVMKDFEKLPNVTKVHDLHIWAISDGVPALSVHAVAQDDDCAQAILNINQVCMKHKILHVTAQVQPASFPECLTCGATAQQCAKKF